jgi:hypothetical protein
MEDGAFHDVLTGADYAKWVESAENTHKTLMKEVASGHPVMSAIRPAETRRWRNCAAPREHS